MNLGFKTPEGKLNWKAITGYFASAIIPIVVWVGGFLPMPVFEDELLYRDKNHLELKTKFYRSEINHISSLKREIDREIYKLERAGENIPPFYAEQNAALDASIEEYRAEVAKSEAMTLEIEKKISE
jgi:hypothetical protein